MTEKQKLIVALAALSVIGFIAYQKLVAAPKVQVERLNWDIGEADVNVGGVDYSVTQSDSAVLSGGYQVSFITGFRADLKAEGLARLVLTRNGQVKSVIAEYQN